MPDKKLTDTQNLTIRKCGGTWEYCNVYCSECTRNNYYVSTGLSDSEIVKGLECCTSDSKLRNEFKRSVSRMAEYIEREKARELIKNFGKGAIEDGQTELDPVDDIILLAKGVDLIPTADVVEVRHGEWEEERWCDNFQHICSLCHKTVRVHPQSVAYKYCPYCGAKMDGKGDNNG